MNFQLYCHIISLTPNAKALKSLPASEQCQNFAFAQIPALEWYITELSFLHLNRKCQ